jgi:dipeptidyl aminopeptidase/acylaminoacyl peptidase
MTPSQISSRIRPHIPRETLRVALAALLISGLPAEGLAAQQKPLLTPADYGRFEAVGSPVLSPRGDWLALVVTRVDEQAELRLQPVSGDSVVKYAWGRAPRFSPDGRYVAFAVGLSPEDTRAAERDRKPVRLKAVVRDLHDGTSREFADVREFRFDASGRHIALHGYAPETPRGRGADLRLVNLGTGSVMNYGAIAEYAWSERGSRLALVVATGGGEANGVHVFDVAAERLRVMDSSPSHYRRLAWRSNGADLAVLRSTGTVDGDTVPQVLLAWQGVNGDSPRRMELDVATSALASTHVLLRSATPRWSDDGTRIVVGLRPAPEPTTARDSIDLPKLQIWHTSDVRLIPQQKVQEATDRARTIPAVWTPGTDHLVLAGSSEMETVAILNGWRYAVERVAAEYPWGAMFGRRFHDVWLTDLRTGDRTRVLERVRYSWQSPGGRYLLSFDGEHYSTYDTRSGRSSRITTSVPAAFADTTYDTPTDVLPPHGVAGWLANDAAVLIYDRHDIWRIAPDGSRAERLTRGAEDEVTHRLLRLAERDSVIDPARTYYLSLHGRWTQQRGYARMRMGSAPERLILEDRFITGLARADSADVLVFRSEARNVPSQIWVAGPALADRRMVARMSPFADSVALGSGELLDFTSEAGFPLQGTLLYPAHYDPARTYPMIVYAYEMLSPQTHLFQSPSERSYYNFTAWTQHGYFVLLPDVRFRARDPGVSLLEALRPAVAAATQRANVDPARVGFVGHSWGGYHAAYVATHSTLFAAAVSGAPLTDFVSFMGQIHWNSGVPEPDHWETGQARMEVPYWEDPDAHHRNSPLHRVHEMQTPLLMAHGNKDGVVEFFQATVFYNFARRAGRPMVLLVYEDENHSFQQKANQIDYHRRILEWFGHYLNGDTAPQWITEGMPLDRLESEKRRVAEPGSAAAGVEARH